MGKILELNNFLDKHINLKQIKEKNNYDLIYKIVDTVLIRYKTNFSTIDSFDSQKYKEYIDSIVDYIDEYLLKQEDISLNILLSLHYNIMISLTTTEQIEKKYIWALREKSKFISAATVEWKRIRRWFTAPKFIKKEIKKSIIILNDELKTNNKEKQFNAIIHFVLFNLFITHPFDNGNDKTFSILLDVLLYKYDFFPSFIKKEIFKNMLYKTYAKYSPENNFEKLKQDFKNDIKYIYTHYQM